jgi:hypothetical protein
MLNKYEPHEAYQKTGISGAIVLFAYCDFNGYCLMADPTFVTTGNLFKE